MAEAAAGVAYGVKNVLEYGAALAKGIAYPTLPLKALLKPIDGVDVPRAHHSVSIIKGRAYIFGGKGPKDELAPSHVHMLILPSSGVETTDYKQIDATNQSPPKRYGHSAAVIDDRIYVFGGYAENGEPLQENGAVWVFDTITNSWSHLSASTNGPKPEARGQHSSAGSQHPKPVQRRTDEGSLPQDPPDPAKIVPEPPSPGTYGTIIIQGGQGTAGQDAFQDIWTFDVSTALWAELPEPPNPLSVSPSLALVEHRLYSFASGIVSYLDLHPGSHNDRGGIGELGLTPMGPWTTMARAAEGASEHHPGQRIGSFLAPVTTGQGRNYLALLGGHSATGTVLEDVWALQLKPDGMSAASFKDAARLAIKKDTHEAQWEEVKYHTADGIMVQEHQTGRGIGHRKGLAAAKGTEVDGATVVIWGGLDANGIVRSDGLMITVDR